MIKQLLQQLGFNDKETIVYLEILRQGKATPSDISKMIDVNRTTVYSVAKELIKKGVITEDLGSDKKYLIALPPQDLSKITQKEEEQLSKTKKTIQEAIIELKNLTKDSVYSIPKINFITEENLEHHLYKQTPIWNQSLEETKSEWFGFQDPTLVVYYQKWIDWYWNNKDSQKVILKLLSSKHEVEKEMKGKDYSRRKIKFWDKSESFTATTWVAGNYIIMIRTNERPHYLVEICDADMANNMREIFKGIWKMV